MDSPKRIVWLAESKTSIQRSPRLPDSKVSINSDADDCLNNCLKSRFIELKSVIASCWKLLENRNINRPEFDFSTEPKETREKILLGQEQSVERVADERENATIRAEIEAEWRAKICRVSDLRSLVHEIDVIQADISLMHERNNNDKRRLLDLRYEAQKWKSSRSRYDVDMQRNERKRDELVSLQSKLVEKQLENKERCKEIENKKLQMQCLTAEIEAKEAIVNEMERKVFELEEEARKMGELGEAKVAEMKSIFPCTSCSMEH
jgi:chromosome segregation ATPase